MWTALRLWISSFTRRDRFEDELTAQLEFHVAARAEQWEREPLRLLRSDRPAINRRKIGWITGDTVRWIDILPKDLRGDRDTAADKNRAHLDRGNSKGRGILLACCRAQRLPNAKERE